MTEREELHETGKHGKLNFPYTVYHGIIPTWMYGFPLHWHEEFEIISIIKGIGIFTVQSESYTCRKGDLLVIPPGYIHSIAQYQDSTIEYYNILFQFSLLEENTASVCYQKYFLPFLQDHVLKRSYLSASDPLAQTLVPHVQGLIDCRYGHYSGLELLVKSHLYAILHLLQPELIPAPDGSASLRQDMQHLKKILSHVHGHYAEAISVQDAASICALSPSHFMKDFKRLTGKSFITYLNEYRLEEALIQLQKSTRKIIDIAQDCGFDNVSYFIRSFKARYGKTPSQYRKNNAK